jgi:hypothetical protein
MTARGHICAHFASHGTVSALIVNDWRYQIGNRDILPKSISQAVAARGRAAMPALALMWAPEP